MVSVGVNLNAVVSRLCRDFLPQRCKRRKLGLPSASCHRATIQLTVFGFCGCHYNRRLPSTPTFLAQGFWINVFSPHRSVVWAINLRTCELHPTHLCVAIDWSIRWLGSFPLVHRLQRVWGLLLHSSRSIIKTILTGLFATLCVDEMTLEEDFSFCLPHSLRCIRILSIYLSMCL